MKAIRFRVQNFRNIDDSGWIELDIVTAFVGRNESGKTALLKALHKFNSATQDPYDAQREFPRDRYTRDYDESRAGELPVCSIEFEIPEAVLLRSIDSVENFGILPKTAIITCYYDNSFRVDRYTPSIVLNPISPDTLVEALGEYLVSSRCLDISDIDQDNIELRREELIEWATEWREKMENVTDLRSEEGAQMVSTLQDTIPSLDEPNTSTMNEDLLKETKLILDTISQDSIQDIEDKLLNELPVLIYFENYGVLDSSIWLSRFLEDADNNSDDSRVRTINAMFKHAHLDPRELHSLDEDPDERQKEERAIKLNSASIDISRSFSEWWSQRRHKFRYQADGDYFRIWVADDVRPDVDIELEARSKGFQWFFSFYLVFLVESEEFHKDAILLLDEPGLHPTAQQELIPFLEGLSEKNQLIYTTHSPFLIDGENLHRVRPVTEDDSGRSRITAETWPMDRDTIFPLQAAAGYAMMRGLFQQHKNVLVEGITDYYYLQELSHQCTKSGRTNLPDDIYIVPCGGTKNVGILASLFLGEKVRPLVLLDGDEAGRVRQNTLLRELYMGYESNIIMLDDILHRTGQEVEIEEILGEKLILDGLMAILGKDFTLDQDDSLSNSLSKRIKLAAERQSIELPEGWKLSVASHIVSQLSKDEMRLTDDSLNYAANLFKIMRTRFDDT